MTPSRDSPSVDKVGAGSGLEAEVVALGHGVHTSVGVVDAAAGEDGVSLVANYLTRKDPES